MIFVLEAGIFVTIWSFTLISWVCALVLINCLDIWGLGKKVQLITALVSITMIVVLLVILVRSLLQFKGVASENIVMKINMVKV